MTYIGIMIAKILNDLYIQNYKKTAKRNQRRYREIKRHPLLMDFRTILFKYPCYPKCSTASMDPYPNSKRILAKIEKTHWNSHGIKQTKKRSEETR